MYTLCKAARKAKHLLKNKEKQILQERRVVLQKLKKNGLAK